MYVPLNKIVVFLFPSNLIGRLYLINFLALYIEKKIKNKITIDDKIELAPCKRKIIWYLAYPSPSPQPCWSPLIGALSFGTWPKLLF